MKIRTLALIVLLGSALSACSFSLAEDITPPPGYQSPTPLPTVGPLYAAEPPSPARGAPIYAEKCAPCHAADGLGNGSLATEMPVTVPAIGLRDIASQFSPADWFTIVTQGSLQRGMPPFLSLTALQRWDVLAYVDTLSTTPDELQRGEALYAGQCAACHGTGGRGDGPQAAGLNPAPTDFTDQTVMAGTTGTGLYRAIAEGVAPGMQAFSQLSQDDTWALVAYLRTLAFDQTVATPTAAATATSLLPAGTTTPASGTPEAASGGTPSVTAVPGVQPGTVSGTVVAGAGGALPSGLTVSLRGFDPDPAGGNPKEVVTLAQPLPDSGAFAFANVEMPAGRIFISQVDYSGVPYQSAFATAAQGVSSLDLPPDTIYPTTPDLNTLAVEQVHFILDFSTSGTMQVVALYIMTNTSQTTVLVPSDGSNIPFVKLPDGAGNVSFQVANGSAAFIGTGTGFAIVPASADQKYGLVVLFDLPYTNKLSVSLPFVLASDAVTLLTPEGVSISGAQISDGGTQNVQGTNYHVYNGPAMAANSVLDVLISGAPAAAAAGATSTSTRTGLMIGAGGLGLVLIGIGVVLFLRDRARGDGEEPEETEAGADSLGNDPDHITDAIIALDEKFKAGELAREAYESRRAELKERLRKSLE